MANSAGSGHVLWFATQGSTHIEAERMRYLLEALDAVPFRFEHDRKLRSAVGLLRAALARRPRLIVMEGTGLAGGLALLAIDAVLGVPFVVSGGDAVAPYLRLRSRVVGPFAAAYERLLCKRCAGYIGWTPYLAGRALTFGAPRAMTAPGWARSEAGAGAGETVRSRLGIAPDAVVVGLAGMLHWRARVGYAYGAELVRSVRAVERDDIVALIVGDGSGRARLQELAGEDLGRRVLLPGRVAPEQVPDYLAAFDLASLPQSVDGVGSFRYTTKLSEYLAAGLPIITGQIPAAYDLDRGFLWRLPGPAPWSTTYVEALTALLESLTRAEIARKSPDGGHRLHDVFDRAAQQRRVSAFIGELLTQLDE